MASEFSQERRLRVRRPRPAEIVVPSGERSRAAAPVVVGLELERVSPDGPPRVMTMISKKKRRDASFGGAGEDGTRSAVRPSSDSDELRRIEVALSTLRRIDRQIFLAAYVDHLTDAEIACRAGLTIDQVERRLARTVVAFDGALRGAPGPWWQQLRQLPWWPFG